MNHHPPTYGLDEVNVSFLSPEKKTLPLVISPRWDSSLKFLCTFLEVNRDWINQSILNYGAVLMRGFDVGSSVDFEQAILKFQPCLCNSYQGTSPRIQMEGTNYTFSAAEVPVNYPIAQHCEMSFLKAPPRNLYFGCLKASQSGGGETALCDFRKVYQDISPELRQKLLVKKIKYERTHHKVGDKYTYDVAAMLGWPELFGTSDMAEVERLCKEEGSPKVQWMDGDTTCYQEWIDEPFQLHPVTNEPVWFNHTQVFHWTTFPAELWYAFWRIKEFKLFLHFVLVTIFSVIKYGMLGYKMSLHSSFGDGSPLTMSEMAEIRRAIHNNMVFSRWQVGDIMCIDNFSTSHGRQPTYDKGRKVIVAWSEPFEKTNRLTHHKPQQQEEEAVLSTKTKILHADHDLPNLMATTPDTSPETTLTSAEAQELKESLLSTKELSHALYQEETLRKNLQEQIIEIKQAGKRGASHHKRRFSWPPRDKGAAVLFHQDSDFWKAE